MSTTITRRNLIVTATGTAMAVSAKAQSAQAPADLAATVRDLNQRAGEALAKFEIPLSTEPAFQFKA